MADLIVKSAVKQTLDEHNVSADFSGALDTEIAEIIADPTRRADANDRKATNHETSDDPAR